jgi:hypothetical protein
MSLALAALAIAGCALEPTEDQAESDVEVAENELAVCDDAKTLELVDFKITDANGKSAAKTITTTRPFSVVAGHTYILTTTLRNNGKTFDDFVNYPGMVVNARPTTIKTKNTYSQTFGIPEAASAELTAEIKIPADACTAPGKLYAAPTANWGRCKGPVTKTFTFNVNAR